MEDQRNLPAGTVTFLFTDIEGSTRLLGALRERYADLLAEHHALLRALVREGGGEEVDSQGDALFVAFARAGDAAKTAIACQRAIAAHAWPEGSRLRIRMGLHTGEPLRAAAGYVGMDVHRAARICAAGHGGQILLSQATRELVHQDLPEGVTLRDLGAHGLKDLAQAEHLFQLVIPELRTDFPPLKSLDALPNNLPRQLTRFVGRERELDEVRKLLSETSLLTLTGVGGCGKTRLALQVAADALEDFKDGVWFVELAALTDPNLVTHAVASALGLQEVRGRPLLSTLTDHLRNKQLLLCLDNCEHLIVECAKLADTLLRASADLRILATSREALGISGERIFPVPSLTLPGVGETPAELAGSEAVRLFVERADFGRPGFLLTQGNAAAVAKVCRRLDGIPLALELAAAKLRVLSVEELAARLDDRFRLLTGGSRTALPRHQTLLAAIDWSYALLSDKERTLLRRASVFAGGFTLEAAEAICSDDAIAPDEVLTLVTQLVEKSLLKATGQEGKTRYALLETVRQFAREKLLQSEDEAAGVRSRHLDWYLDLAELAEPQLTTKDQLDWFERLEREHDNFRAALEWALGLAGPEAALRLASALTWFWYARGYWSEAFAWFERALARREGAALRVVARGLIAAAIMTFWTKGDRERAEWLIREALALFEQIGDRDGQSKAFHHLGIAVMVKVNPQELWEASLALAREGSDHSHTASVLSNLALLADRQGERDRAAALFDESLTLARGTGDRWVLAHILHDMSEAACRAGDYDRAEKLGQESLALALEVGHKVWIFSCLVVLAEIAGARGRAEGAAVLIGAAEGVAATLGPGLIDRGRFDAAVRETLGEAAYQSAWAKGREMTIERAVVYALERPPK